MYYFDKKLAEQRGLPVQEFQFKFDPYQNKDPDSIDRQVFCLRFPELQHDNAIQRIIHHFEHSLPFYDVGVQGLPSNTEVGSRRITTYDEGFAKYLTSLMIDKLSPLILTPYSDVDWMSQNPDELNVWVPVGISPVFRYMRYRNGSKHFVHYDAPFINPENPLTRTLMSGVLYLTDSKDCKTCFMPQTQAHLPISQRQMKDWEHEVFEEQAEVMIPSEKGKVSLFYHQIPHFVTEHKEDHDRIIIRFDVMFQAVGKIS